MSKSKKLINQIKEDFMEPEVFKDSGYEIDTTQGTMFLPSDVIGKLDFKGEEINDKEDIAKLWPDIKDYLEVSKAEDVYYVRKIKGWFGRMSASGYLDATDYTFGKTKKEVEDSLENMYGDDF